MIVALLNESDAKYTHTAGPETWIVKRDEKRSNYLRFEFCRSLEISSAYTVTLSVIHIRQPPLFECAFVRNQIKNSSIAEPL
jgi:hypothetical protein